MADKENSINPETGQNIEGKNYPASKDFKAMPRFHRTMGTIYLLLLFLSTNLGLGFLFYHYPSSPLFRGTAWLLIIIFLGLVVNNFTMPKRKSAVWLLVLGIPIELAVVTIVMGWSWKVYFVEWVCIEFAAMFGGLMMATVFKKAPISILHRLASMILALVFMAAVLSGFFAAIEEIYGSNPGLHWLLLIVPVGHAFYNDAQWFIQGEKKGTMNMGTSQLTDKFSGLMALMAISWLILAGLLSSLGQG